jgi:pentatricopeptide repeat protein
MEKCIEAQRAGRALMLYRMMIKRGLRPSERIVILALTCCVMLREPETAFGVPYPLHMIILV